MIVRLQAICSYSLARLSAFADYSWRSRRTGRKMRKMRHKNWKTYLNLPVSINEFMYGTKKKERGVEGYQQLKESYHEASRAIKYIDIIRLVTGDKNKSVVHYSNLGFFQIFGEIDDVTELERYIPETLKKLYLYDDEHKGELITTLQIYLRNNQSIKKTADAMFVHYRTISYRIEKIKQISGINFDNANEVLAVSNGLIIYKMLKEIE